MNFSTFPQLKVGLKLLLLLLKGITILANDYTVKEVVELFNQEYRFELNIFLKLKSSDEPNEFEKILQAVETPKVVINDFRANVTASCKFNNKQSLTVVYLNNDNRSEWFELMGKLLWKLHLSHILIIYQDIDENVKPSLAQIFQQCWEKGFVNVLLWQQKQLFTYNPYPRIQTLHLENFSAFGQRLYLQNFQHYAWIVPFFEFPPRCFSYTNRWGQLVRSGFFFKIVELFIHQHNGTMNIYDINMWAANITQEQALQIFKKKGFHFLCNAMFIDDYYDTSDTLWIFNRYLIVPAAQEITRSLYIIKPFKTLVWLVVLVIASLLYCLIYCENKWNNSNRGQQSPLLETVAIIYALPYSAFRRKKLINVFLVLINLVACWMLDSFYNCNLSSFLVTKLYNPELKTLEDIGKTNLFIYEYSLDVQYYKDKDFPAIIQRRLISGNNSYMFHHRRNLNVDLNIFCATIEVADYYLLQQLYLKHRKAKLLDESMYGQTFFFALAHRLAVLDHFNRYLLYIKESGIVDKLQKDSQWDGILSGDIKFFVDDDISPSFTLEHFRFAFAAWMIGLLGGLICFVIEIRCKKN